MCEVTQPVQMLYYVLPCFGAVQGITDEFPEDVLQALVLASSVQMAHSALGNTPAIITPPLVSPATPNEPGATPMQVC